MRLCHLPRPIWSHGVVRFGCDAARVASVARSGWMTGRGNTSSPGDAFASIFRWARSSVCLTVRHAAGGGHRPARVPSCDALLNWLVCVDALPPISSGTPMPWSGTYGIRQATAELTFGRDIVVSRSTVDRSCASSGSVVFRIADCRKVRGWRRSARLTWSAGGSLAIDRTRCGSPTSPNAPRMGGRCP
jgi:hypothetical protein